MTEYDRMNTCLHHNVTFRGNYNNWHLCGVHQIPMNCDKCTEYEPIPEEPPLTTEERIIRLSEAISKIAFSMEIINRNVQTLMETITAMRLEQRMDDVPIIKVEERTCDKEEPPYEYDMNYQQLEPMEREDQWH